MEDQEQQKKLTNECVYEAMRDEAVQRVNMCYGMYNLAITSFGVLAAFAVEFKQPAALLIYPALSLCLALSWHHNSLIVRKINSVLCQMSDAEMKLRTPGVHDKFFDISNRVIFGVTSGAAIILGIVVFPEILKLTWGLWIPILLALCSFLPVIGRE